MVDRRQLHGRRMIRHLQGEPLERRVEIEQQRPLAIIADHALDPEERRPREPGDRLDVMQAGRRIEAIDPACCSPRENA